MLHNAPALSCSWVTSVVLLWCVREQETMFLGLGPQRPLPPPPQGGDKYVALVSGLSVGDEGGEPVRVALLVDYLAGLLGSAPEQEQVAQVGAPTIALLASTAVAAGHIRQLMQ